jgi:hypothetical protein
MNDEPPVGPPKHNPLTADHYAGLERAKENLHVMADAIARMYHIFGDHQLVVQQASQHEMQDKVIQRMHAMYPPKRNPIAE